MVCLDSGEGRLASNALSLLFNFARSSIASVLLLSARRMIVSGSRVM